MQPKTGHTLYVENVKAQFIPSCRWLDAGGGHRIFHDQEDGEVELVNSASLVVVCDVNVESLRRHESVVNRVCCNLSNLPFREGSFDFVTCGMVVEHLPNPSGVCRELFRCIQSGGKLMIHTPNLSGHATVIAVLSKVIPANFRRSLISKLTGRNESDIFSTFYKANTPKSLRRVVASSGLNVESVQLLQSGTLFRKVPILKTIELFYMRLIQLPSLAFLRGQLLISAIKPNKPVSKSLNS
jgi:ubiquinone/menaquinone biosynthesis C-methylase UbiE